MASRLWFPSNVPTTETVVDQNPKSILHRMFTGNLFGIGTKEVPCDHVFLFDSNALIAPHVLKISRDDT